MSESNWIAGEKLRAQAIERTRDEYERPWLYTLEVESMKQVQYIVPIDFVKSEASKRLRYLESIGSGQPLIGQEGGGTSKAGKPPHASGRLF